MDKVRKRSQRSGTPDISIITSPETASFRQVPSVSHTAPVFGIETPLFPEVDETSPSYRSSFRCPDTPVEEEKW